MAVVSLYVVTRHNYLGKFSYTVSRNWFTKLAQETIGVKHQIAEDIIAPLTVLIKKSG